jgi:hypothetical protein
MSPARSLLALLVLFWAHPPYIAQAEQSASIRVTFSPERLGHSTSVSFSAQIAARPDSAPSPLTRFRLSYPSALGFSTSDLGLVSCLPERVEAFGPRACPRNSHMGQGTVLTSIPYGRRTIRERTHMSILRAPEESGHPALLFYLAGTSPVIAQIMLRGLLLPGRRDSEESLLTDVPIVSILPGGPYATLTRFEMTIGSAGLIYRERLHGKLISYRPQGILLPNTCPRGGFAFHATFDFLDGSQADARAVVPCPVHQS